VAHDASVPKASEVVPYKVESRFSYVISVLVFSQCPDWSKMVDGAEANELGLLAGFEKCGRKPRRDLFLDEMSRVVPWSELEALVEPHYPGARSGRCL
jgi:hypothetical protein